MFFGTGGPFAAAVRDALTELGLTAVDGPHPRADILATDGKYLLAIEAKGLEGPAREFNLRQTGQWISDAAATLAADADDLNEDPHLQRYDEVISVLKQTSNTNAFEGVRGLLVVGSFRKKPLNDRSEPTFSHDLSMAIGRSNVCAVTGLQLYTLLLKARLDQQLKPAIVSTLATTNGVLKEGNDWQQILSLKT